MTANINITKLSDRPSASTSSAINTQVIALKWVNYPIVLVLFFIGFQCTAGAQNVQERVRRLDKFPIEDSTRHGVESDIEEEGTELTQELEFDYGGILNFAYINFTDGDEKHMLRVTDLRLWGNLVFRDTHQVYFRALGRLQDYNKGTEYFYMDENDWSIPRMDVGYYKSDLTRAFGMEEVGRLRFKAGRDYYRTGVGMALDRRGDGAHLEYRKEFDDDMLTWSPALHATHHQCDIEPAHALSAVQDPPRILGNLTEVRQ